jgi:competence protein ComEC
MSDMTVAFLEVGQGDSTVVLLPDRRSAVVIDSSSPAKTADYLESAGITSLSRIYFTHTDLDHFAGVADIAENYATKDTELLFNIDFHSPDAQGKARTLMRKVARICAQKGLPLSHVHVGDAWSSQGLEVTALHPEFRDLVEAVGLRDKNNASCVLLLKFADRKILLSADLRGRGWKWLLERGTDISADVLKFPHHGAEYAAGDGEPTLEHVLDLINPSIAIVSVGSDNSYGHPAESSLSLLNGRAPRLRYLCTQATKRCHPSLEGAGRTRASCAGTIEVKVDASNGAISVTPNAQDHAAIIKQFDVPWCVQSN